MSATLHAKRERKEQRHARANKRNANAITAKELAAHIPDLKVTDRQREFVKAAFRALISAVLSKRFNARIDI